MHRILALTLSLVVSGAAFAQQGSGAAGESLERFKDDITHSNTPNSKHEKGNLSEVGGKELLTDQNFAAALKASKKQPVFIFKHSTECPVSAGAYRRFSKWIKDNPKEAPPTYLVKVIERRPVSKNIEAKLAVKHESPQILLLNEGKVVWHTSHEAIESKAIEKAIKSLPKQQ